MLLPCKSLTYNTVYRSETVVVVVAAVVVVIMVIVIVVVKIGIKFRNTEMMITRLTIQDTNYTELSFFKIVYSYVKYPQIYFKQVYMAFNTEENARRAPWLRHDNVLVNHF